MKRYDEMENCIAKQNRFLDKAVYIINYNLNIINDNISSINAKMHAFDKIESYDMFADADDKEFEELFK